MNNRGGKKEKENIPRNNLVNDNFTSAIYHVPSMISVLEHVNDGLSDH